MSPVTVQCQLCVWKNRVGVVNEGQIQLNGVEI